MCRHPHSNTIYAICDMYLLLKPASHREKDLVSSTIPMGLYSYVARNPQRLVYGSLNNDVAPIKWEKTKTVTVQAMWAEGTRPTRVASACKAESLGKPTSPDLVHPNKCSGCQ